MDYTQTVDIMFDVVNTAWTEHSTAILGSPAIIQWPKVEKEDPPPNDDFWLQVRILTLSEEQKSLKNVNTCYETSGLLLLLINAPKSDAQFRKAMSIANLMKNEFKGLRIGDLKFLKSQIQESDPEEKDYAVLISVNYEHFFSI